VLTTGKKLGIRTKDYVKILDLENEQINLLLNSFFTPLSDSDKKK
jgi:hypothetical protein